MKTLLISSHFQAQNPYAIRFIWHSRVKNITTLNVSRSGFYINTFKLILRTYPDSEPNTVLIKIKYFCILFGFEKKLKTRSRVCQFNILGTQTVENRK